MREFLLILTSAMSLGGSGLLEEGLRRRSIAFRRSSTVHSEKS
jgi:hypothetical protein